MDTDDKSRTRQPETTPRSYDYLPVTLSIETKGGIATPLIKRGTPLPTVRSQVFSTATDNQPSVEISVLLGERPLARHNRAVGKCLLDDIPFAKAGTPQIWVTFELTRTLQLNIKAEETASHKVVQTNFTDRPIAITDVQVLGLHRDAELNKTRDDAETALAEAESLVQTQQLKKAITGHTPKLEATISLLGEALMSGSNDQIVDLTKHLRALLEEAKSVDTWPDFSSIFGGFSSQRYGTTKPNSRQPALSAKSTNSTPPVTPRPPVPALLSVTPTPVTAQIQGFLERIDPELESKRIGAWKTLESATPDALSQASNSMRELIRQLLDNLAPVAKVQTAPWYQKPSGTSPVTRTMRIRYAIAGPSATPRESTLVFIKTMADAIDAMYAKLSAETHSGKRPTVSTIRMYLNACEALIGIICVEHKS